MKPTFKVLWGAVDLKTKMLEVLNGGTLIWGLLNLDH
jgi:hypothetical protein